MKDRMIGMAPIKMAAVCKGRYFGSPEQGEQEITDLTTDSRKVMPGGMFAAIRGNRVDGNRFVPECYQKGVLCCLSEEPPQAPADLQKAYIQVDSCQQALKDLAEYYRQSCNIQVIGITGSVGKTTTKEMVASVLSQKYDTLKTLGNFNNELGLPLTIFRLRENHEIAVLEMGISDFGEMTRLSKIARPDHCIITNIGQCHLEQLGDRDGVLRAKTEIFSYLRPGGRVYLNGDDDKLASLEGDSRIQPPIFFGLDSSWEYHARGIESLGLEGSRARLATPSGEFEVKIPVPGRHMIYNALVSAAVGLDYGLTLEEIRTGIESFVPVGGRSNVIRTGSLTVMDDCYNANPVSMKAGLDVLADVPRGRRVAILGDMFELGEQEAQLHYQVGAHAAARGIDLVLAVGSLAQEYVRGIEDNNRDRTTATYYFPELEEAIGRLGQLILPGDSILVKASHAMNFEKIVAQLKAI